METPTSSGPGGSSGVVADSLLAHARRHRPRLGDDSPIAELLAAIEPQPLVPHGMVLIAGAVMAMAFRHDRSLAAPGPAADGDTASTDRSF
jgi:type III secretion system FlhB-like substrate exporter